MLLLMNVKFTWTCLIAKVSTFTSLRVGAAQKDESEEGNWVGKKWSIDSDIIPLLPKHCPLTC
jgi:hypothetical protein